MVSMGIIFLSILISLYRFIVGPSVFDRVISFDVMTIASVAIIGIIAVWQARFIYLDIAIVYGLLSFLAVIIIAKYLEKSL
jgi:multicomponent Na+:H+ antiporter subunit F